MTKKLSLVFLLVFVITLAFCSCSSFSDFFKKVDTFLFGDHTLHKPADLVYRSDIVVSKDYNTITVGDTEYVLCGDNYSLPADIKYYGAIVEGENVNEKENSDKFDIVYTSVICSDYMWLISNKEIGNENTNNWILSGQLVMYEKKVKNDSN